jgi:putative transposase
MMKAAEFLSQEVGVKKACYTLGLARASYYRWDPSPSSDFPEEKRPIPSWALSPEERQKVLDLLHTDRFIDQSPREVYATMLDEGTYLCSVRSMYRILDEQGEVRERRDQLRHPVYQPPELLARGANQVWSWDITKLKGPVKWTYYYLYVLLDIFSRYAVGWMVARREQASLAQKLIEESCEKQSIKPGQLIVHSDRGPSMSSKPVALLLADLGVTKTHSRPHVSNDNPYSESQFKTLKYRPDFPERFGSMEDSRGFCQTFFPWYNTEHHHSGISFLTPEQVHYGLAKQIVKEREAVLKMAYQIRPDRFKKGPPKPMPLPEAVWINKPLSKSDAVLQ